MSSCFSIVSKAGIPVLLRLYWSGMKIVIIIKRIVKIITAVVIAIMFCVLNFFTLLSVFSQILFNRARILNQIISNGKNPNEIIKLAKNELLDKFCAA